MLRMCLLALACVGVTTLGQQTNHVDVATEEQLVAAIESNTTISFTADIFLQADSIYVTDVVSLDVQGNGFVLSGQQLLRCFFVTGSVTTMNVADLVIQDGIGDSGGGGMYVIDSTVTLMRCTLQRCVATGSMPFGGGISAQQANLVVSDCVFSRNFALSFGAAIYSLIGNLRVFRCSFTDNEAGFGAAIYSLGIDDSRNSIVIDDSTFEDNVASNIGGAIYTSGPFLMEINNSIITNNTAVQFGGGVYASNGAVTQLDGCIFSFNFAGTSGGGLYIDSASLDFQGAATSLLNNTAKFDGAGFYVSGFLFLGQAGAAVTLSSELTFTGNSAGRNGGGFIAYGARLVQKPGSRCYFYWNYAGVGQRAGSGGGAYVAYSGQLVPLVDTGVGHTKLELKNFHFEHNHALKRGGALFLQTAAGTPKPSLLSCDVCGVDEFNATECLFMPVNSTWREWDDASRIILEKFAFVSNTACGAGGSGGALSLVNGNVLVKSTQFISNQAATFGGAVFMPRDHYLEATTALTLDACRFSENYVLSGTTSQAGGRGNDLYSESAAGMNIVNGTRFDVSKLTGAWLEMTRSASTDVDVEMGGNITFDSTSGLFCPTGFQLVQPTLIPPFVETPLPGWNNTKCLSQKGPCSTISESCWPPVIRAPFLFVCFFPSFLLIVLFSFWVTCYLSSTAYFDLSSLSLFSSLFTLLA
jgi:predicted outer membrane repeat protein